MQGERDEAARRVVIEALLGGETVSAAARLAKVARRTVYQWRDRGDPEIEAALDRAAELRAAGPVARALEAAPPAPASPPTEDDTLALGALREIAKSGELESNRVSAAKALLDYGHKMRIATKVGPGAPAPAAAPAPEAEVSAEDVAARFRVVS